MGEKKNLKKEWYDSANVITNLIIGTIFAIIICSQAFAINGGISLELFSSIINHNSVYLFILIYFISLKTYFGKKYFNYINILLIFIYFITTITSLLTLVQSFSLSTILDFIINLLFLIYASHTLFRDTRIWRDYHLNNSPFNELSNDGLFCAILVVGSLFLAVNLINTLVVRGVIISLLYFIYILLFNRYIYLYRDYLDKNKIDINNKGNFDAVRDKVQEVLDKTEIDEKLVDVKDKVVDVSKDLGNKIDNFIVDNEIDKKVENITDKVVDSTKDVIDKINKKEKNVKNTSKKGDK